MLRWFLTVLFVIPVIAGCGIWYGLSILDEPGPLPVATDVVIPRGGTDAVGIALRRAGVVSADWRFQIAAYATRGQGAFRAGEYAFPANASLRTALNVVRRAQPVQHKLTIPEGLTAKQIIALLNAEPLLTGPVPPMEEGDILPDTYKFVRDASRASVVTRAREAMDRATQAAWSDRSPGIALTGVDELRTLASLVERETAREDERPMVAAVLLNRLKLGMRLQSDPTVVYAVSGGQGVLDRKLSKADLAAENPYNTYKVAGLPPGPICSPGLASLKAAAVPAAGDALYFVADGTGGHAFAHTLAEHNRNVARLRDGETETPQ